MPLIILEGADGSGKSHMARVISERVERVKYYHATYRFKNAMTLYHTSMMTRAMKHINEGYTVIFDRWWPSELAYGKVYRSKHEPIENFRMLHRLALRYGAVYVLCHRESPQDAITAHGKLAEERNEMFPPDRRMGEVHKTYQRLWEASSRGQEARWLKYNMDTALRNKNYFDFMVGTVIRCSEHYDRIRRNNELMAPHSTGNFFAKYVMVGEKTNPTYHRFDFPWVGYRGCSLAITSALMELQVPESDFFWTNAEGPGDHSEKLKAFIASAPVSSKVVAMGELARKFCEDAGRCNIAMNHPAYLVRFHGQKSLTTTLRKVLEC